MIFSRYKRYWVYWHPLTTIALNSRILNLFIIEMFHYWDIKSISYYDGLGRMYRCVYIFKGLCCLYACFINIMMSIKIDFSVTMHEIERLPSEKCTEGTLPIHYDVSINRLFLYIFHFWFRQDKSSHCLLKVGHFVWCAVSKSFKYGYLFLYYSANDVIAFRKSD